MPNIKMLATQQLCKRQHTMCGRQNSQVVPMIPVPIIHMLCLMASFALENGLHLWAWRTVTLLDQGTQRAKAERFCRYNKAPNQLTLFFRFFNWHVIALQCCLSAVQWHESALHVHIFPPSWISLPPAPHPLHLGHHRGELPVSPVDLS